MTARGILIVLLALWPDVAGAGGWYLLVPPVQPPFITGPNGEFSWLLVHAPRREWRHVAAYDSAESCEAGKRVEVEKAAREGARMDDEMRRGVSAVPPEHQQVTREEHRAYTISLLWSECLASDDPRLR